MYDRQKTTETQGYIYTGYQKANKEQVWKMSCHGNMERQIGTDHRK